MFNNNKNLAVGEGKPDSPPSLAQALDHLKCLEGCSLTYLTGGDVGIVKQGVGLVLNVSELAQRDEQRRSRRRAGKRGDGFPVGVQADPVAEGARPSPRLPDPGTPEAIARGCTCQAIKNGFARAGVFKQDLDCPLHGIDATFDALINACETDA